MKFSAENQPDNAGRKAGSLNKQTQEIKEVISYILELSTKERIEKAVLKLWDKRPDTMLGFISRIAPKQLDFDINDPIIIKFINKKE